jgi:hydrogenase maturation protein HypF
MPGGAQAAREPWRNTFAHLDTAFGWERCLADHPKLGLVRFLETKPLTPLRAMIRNNINSPPASSCGRLFDAVAAALSICRERAGYEGQAAIEVEACVDAQTLERDAGYPFAIALAPCDLPSSTPATLDSRPMWEALLQDLADRTPAPVMAARFHRGLADGLVEMAVRLAQGIETAVLSGGAFQNRILLELVMEGLRTRGFRVLAPLQVPANDGGLSLGQAVIAAARRLNSSEVRPCA